MKRILVSAALIICFLSCEKSKEDDGSYFIKATINSTEINFREQAKALISHGDLTGSIVMSADKEKDALGPSNLILRFVNNNTAIKKGTYTQTSNNGLHFITSTYNPGGDAIYYVYEAGINHKAQPPLTLTITELTNNIISGSFSGAYYHSLPNDTLHFTDSVIITNGSFRLPFRK